jgi:protein-disulfide isomerase
VALALSIVGLAASIASAIDFFSPEPAFCAESGCATVRASAWAHPLGIPMPVLGLGFYALMVALAFVSRPRLRRVLAIAGAAWAVFLIALQAFAIGAWCKLCMIADPAAIGLALAVVAGASTVRPRLRTFALAGSTLAAALAALAVWNKPPVAEPPALSGVPECVARAQVPDRVTVVEFVDFQCPFCRKLQTRLSEAMRRDGRPIHVVRKMKPLAKHEGALPAALAWCCADALGKGDAMADALFAADPHDLTPAGCEKIAASIGLDLDRYRAALPDARARVEADLADAKNAGVQLLPTLYIGAERLTGAGSTVDQLVGLLARTPG